MSALTEKVAREHPEIVNRARTGQHTRCGCGWRPGAPAPGRSQYAVHVAEVTEAATRDAVAADIRAEQFSGRYGTNLAHETFATAARIAEGKQP